ncbi:MAG: hypothetical protein HON47_01815 [Candidatus Diapherotrites archaeon]|jgi:uncharacterized protein|uniref:Proteasome assembly chaperone family protein n=1 Tax=Candidatus Iainarchaeum sp. TaxID=3101447 RepID=A0A8T5GE89_9ARCH|nr:hypothetical protein [Candidatus Diapherotrites archaeon]MBT7240970.1 hypothetical protein [Candidatus Diapherotrites archaeon]
MPTKILVTKKIAAKNAILLVGLPGIGLVGKISVDYLLKELKPERIAEVYSDAFPPSVHTKNSKIHLIKDEIYYLNYKKQDFFFLVGPVQPTLDFKVGSSHEHYEFAETLISFFKASGVSEVITLAGINIGDKRINIKPKVIAAGTDDATLKKWKKMGAKEDKKEGLISGAAGLFVGICKLHKMTGACLMGETNAQLIYGDQGSAKAIIEVLKKRFGFKVKMKLIDKEAKEIETAFKDLNMQLESLEEETPNNNLPYVR